MNRGFTVIETMITLVIAGIFLLSGYQLFLAVDARSVEIRRLSVASNVAYGNLREHGRYPMTTSLPQCDAGGADHRVVTPLTGAIELPQPIEGWIEYCKVPESGLVRVISTVKYGSGQSQGETRHATYLVP
ncbi:MAG: prepilin-type N-terminal cleavage/methylation domain-containing protein [Candidatus Saccharibacteria bacterium]|nr:prepilin-type N-terminal cleavage/methylation domain-containing protein [Candidatus Saccharibacteria bacterium]